MKPILTVPKRAAPPPFVATGNEWVSLPSLHPKTGGLFSITLLSERGGGLLELKGTEEFPLLSPYFLDGGGASFRLSRHRLSFEGHFYPRVSFSSPQLEVLLDCFAPENSRGFCYELTVTARHRLALEAGIAGEFAAAHQATFQRTPLSGERRLLFHSFTQTLVLEAVPGFPEAALALLPEGEGAPHFEGGIGRPGKLLENTWFAVPCSQLMPLAYKIFYSLKLEEGEKQTLTFYGGVGRTADAAATAAVALARRGSRDLKRESLKRLKRLYASAPSAKTLSSKAFSRACRNLSFSRTFSLGRAMDTEALFSLTSRSPLYYVSAAFWERDALLWSLPPLVAADPSLAREVLFTIVQRHARNAGEHAHTITGEVLYPGFELDQLAAYGVALSFYTEWTKDSSLSRDPLVLRTLEALLAKLEEFRHPKLPLYATELFPSDDPATHPYCTYDNVLVWRFLTSCAPYLSSREKELRRKAEEIRSSLFRRAVFSRGKKRQFAYALTEEGEPLFYDDPPGSLLLLPFYGFLEEEDPLFQNTASWILSPSNPYWLKGRFSGPGCEHYPKTISVMTLCAMLLTKRFRPLAQEMLTKLQLDQGICCESVDPETGAVATGAAFASLAGFLSFALLWGESPWQK